MLLCHFHQHGRINEKYENEDQSFFYFDDNKNGKSQEVHNAWEFLPFLTFHDT